MSIHGAPSPIDHPAQPVGDRVAAALVADAAVALWRELSAALTPVIGPRGVTALYRRALHLALATHPSLAQAQADDAEPFEELHATLTRLSASDAAAAQAALLNTFHALLTSLIGPGLTERLLASAQSSTSSGTHAQDISP